MDHLSGDAAEGKALPNSTLNQTVRAALSRGALAKRAATLGRAHDRATSRRGDGASRRKPSSTRAQRPSLQQRPEIAAAVEPNSLIWCVAGAATLGVIVRPFGLPEFIWAVLGAAALVALGLLPWRDALAAAGKGTDVYLFLGGMMLLAEVARQEGLFDWLAALAVRSARGSAKRLFLIVYGVGTLVTIFLSNDATAVVLTPAVYAAATAARVKPLPYLLICAFIANAASFVLPISNPANLVIFGDHMPPLRDLACPLHAALDRGDRRHLCGAALHATPRARSEDCRRRCRRRLSLGGGMASRSESAWPRSRCWRPRRSTGRSACRPSSPAWS